MRCRASTASSTTSARSRRPRSSGSDPLRAARRLVPVAAIGALAGCGLAMPSPAIDRALEPPPDGVILEPARGETAGAPWAFGVYRSGANVCLYTVEGDLVQGPSCGPLPEVGNFGPL